MKKITELFRTSLKELSVTRNLVLCGLMAALAIVLGTVASISIGRYIKIGFSGGKTRFYMPKELKEQLKDIPKLYLESLEYHNQNTDKVVDFMDSIAFER